MTASMEVVSPAPKKIVTAIMRRLPTCRRNALKIILKKNMETYTLEP